MSRYFLKKTKIARLNSKICGIKCAAPSRLEPMPPAEPKGGPAPDPAGILQPYWDYGPSARHTQSIQLLSEAEVRGLGGEESLVAHWEALMRHIETNSAPVLSQISPDTAVHHPPLDEYTDAGGFSPPKSFPDGKSVGNIPR